MNRNCAVLLCAAALWPLGAAHAQMFKCVGADGKTSYQADPCPTASREQKVDVAPSGPGPTAPMKAGWDPREVKFMGDACANVILIDARQQFQYEGKPFPEAQLAPPVERYCTCVMRRVASLHTRDDYAQDPRRMSARVAQDALGGGPCQPDGLHAELLRKSGKMK